MLADRQLEKQIQLASLSLMKLGQFPDINTVLNLIRNRMQGSSFGSPLTKIRPAVIGSLIGGEDGKDINRTFYEIKEDLETLFEELYSAESDQISSYLSNLMRKESLIQRLTSLNSEAQQSVETKSAGGNLIIGDSFNSLSQIDMDISTIEPVLSQGYVTIPRAGSETRRFNSENIVISSINYPSGSRIYGDPNSILNDYSDDALIIESDSSDISTEIILTLDPSLVSSYQINRLYISLSGPTNVSLYYSNDLSNWNNICENQKVVSERTFDFQSANVNYIKIIVQGSTVGIKRFVLFYLKHHLSAQLYSQEYQIPIGLGINQISFSSITDIPAGSNISFTGMKKVGSDSDWTLFDIANTTFLLDQDEISYSFSSFKREDEIIPGSISNLYFGLIGNLENGSGINVSTPNFNKGILRKGKDQFLVEAFLLDRNLLPDGVVNPILSDWSNTNLNILSGFTNLISNLDCNSMQGNTSDSLYGNNTFLCQASVGQDLYSNNAMYFSILPYDANYTMQPKYNYKFTAWIYSQDNQVLYDQKAFILNPEFTTLDTDLLVDTKIANLSIYLNNENIFSTNEAVRPITDNIASAGVTENASAGYLPIGEHYYAITAVTSFGETALSSWSSSGVTVSNGDTKTANISWTLSTSNLIQYYKIYRKTINADSSITISFIKTALSTQNSTTDDGTEFISSVNPPTINAAVNLDSITNSCIWKLNKGWNKVNILIYVNNDITPGSNGYSTGGLGIYIEPNILTINKTNLGLDPDFGMLADNTNLKLVSEFMLRNNIPSRAGGYWAWKTNDSNFGVLINPTQDEIVSSIQARNSVDGWASNQAINYLITYFPVNKNQITLKLRADLSMDSPQGQPPKIFNYKINLS